MRQKLLVFCIDENIDFVTIGRIEKNNENRSSFQTFTLIFIFLSFFKFTKILDENIRNNIQDK
jgi:hypothetical protein